ncbi:hypothetical protein SAMN04487972_1219 [Paracoccus halophilus]|uniref:PD-(D/E)XK nuclease superfamily protein n=1 Tax=Paracoccus halophilus TaxID=376733 RepID=A0A1I0U3J4_9RHOB|nr:hypothetical protein [Paracoccus halophilus]SFA58578.1 hypothetical protein SAMN04487972_1219 [Paracoccus halophilus]
MERAGKPKFSKEQHVQDWLESVIAADKLSDAIIDAGKVREKLAEYESPEFKPSFPIDYLTRLGNLRAAQHVLESLHTLELVSKNNRSISREKGESLFVDLLYCTRESSRFILFEIKNQDGSAREAVTEIIAYEHEALNHMPFSSANDVMMVIVSRDFSTLLDHAVTGLNSWSRRRVLCLRFDDGEESPRLVVHIPTAWSAIGQKSLSANGIVTATLSFKPSPDLEEDDIHAVCSTAASLMVRESERSGSSGFAIVAYNHLYPGMADSPYLILAGVVNPFSFLERAQSEGFLANSRSPMSDYILSDGRTHDLTASWDWLSCDGGAAVEYLKGYGSPEWAFSQGWEEIRNIERWRYPGLTLDRHIMPIAIDFWGVLGDYVRDAVRHVERMRNFMSSCARPGMDWRHPILGVLLLDEIASAPPLIDGQWTFSALFRLGLLLGRFGSLSAQMADAEPEQQRLLQASSFWAEVDMAGLLQEVALRYMSAEDMGEAPPIIAVRQCETGEEAFASVSAFADWISRAFIGEDEKLMHAAFSTGWQVHAIFDWQFDVTQDNPQVASLRELAVARARDWLKWSVVAACGDGRDAGTATRAITASFGDQVPLTAGKDTALAAIDELNPSTLIDKLLIEIPRIVDSWHPQLAHTLVPVASIGHDWDWVEQQIAAARKRGEKHPCVCIGAGGEIAVGILPSFPWIPVVENVTEKVLLSSNSSGSELILVVSWEDLRAGKVPGLS